MVCRRARAGSAHRARARRGIGLAGARVIGATPEPPNCSQDASPAERSRVCHARSKEHAPCQPAARVAWEFSALATRAVCQLVPMRPAAGQLQDRTGTPRPEAPGSGAQRRPGPPLLLPSQPPAPASAPTTGGGGGTRQVSSVAAAFGPTLQVAPGTAVRTDAQSASVAQTRRALLALLPGQAATAPAAGAAGVTQAGNAPPP